MKRRVFIICIILVLCPVCTTLAIELPEIEGYDMFADTAKSITDGSFSLNPIKIFNNIISSFTSQIKEFSATAIIILVMSMLSSTVKTLNCALGEKASGEAAFFTFFTVISGLTLSCFLTALEYGKEVISLMTSFMNKFTPVITVMLFASSKELSAVGFEPVLATSVMVVSEVIGRCLVPLITFSAILSVAGNVGDKNSISGFLKIVKSGTKWIMALIITVFTGINTAYGFTSPALDAVGAKAIKFAVGSLVPVVGGFLSDSFDTVVSSVSIMKNAVGVSGIIVMCSICIVPIIKIGVMQIMLKLISAVSEPICDKRISAMIWDVSEALTAVFGVVVFTAVLFIINICIILRATG